MSNTTKRNLENGGEESKKSLKEKFAELRAKQPDFQLDNQTLNVVGVTIFWYFLIIVPIIHYVFILPSITKTWIEYGIHTGLLMFLSIQCLVNWKRCFTELHDDIVSCPDCKSKGVMSSIPKRREVIDDRPACPLWRYCSHCHTDTPPRSYHCRVCKVCILKRDHHCYFTGRCVGFHTHRRFFVLCFYLFFALAYSVWSYFSYLSKWQPLIPLNLKSLTSYIIPINIINFFIYSEVTVAFIINLLHCYLCIGLFFLDVIFVVWEFSIILRGQTSYEAGHGINRYRSNVMDNIRSVFGKFAILHFIWPVRTEIKGDGVNWPVGKVMKSN